MSTTPENPHIGKHDPQREADWNDGFEESRARIAELEEAARRYFNADGSVSLMVSAEAVVEARKAAALRIAELEAQVRERDGLLRQVLDPDDCRLDHHGFCQTHGWMDRSGCPHARIRSLIGGAK